MIPINAHFWAFVLLQSIAIITIPNVQGKAVGRKESRLTPNELRQRYESVKSKRTAHSNMRQEEAEIYQSLLRAIREYEKKQSPNTNEVKNKTQPEDGAKLIEDALKGKVDPNSDVVNLLESMFVDEGNRHDLQPEGINKIASKKGKVFGDTHDGHKLTPDQINELNGGNGKGKRNFGRNIQLWTDKIIPYTIASSLSSVQGNVDTINKAIQQFTDYTCLRWVPYGSAEANQASYPNYVEFFSESGCWSYVGRVRSGKQEISLQSPRCVSVSTTVHEMAHAIGQFHEQSRNDRDNHITMIWSNIDGGQNNNNMQKYNTFDYNPYDYQSVLQYSLTSFSINGQAVMKFRDRRLEFLADSATGLMFYDIQDITDAYDCTKPCRGPSGSDPLKQCQNGGFVIHTCDCLCPYGITGDLCQTVDTDPECGPGLITLADGETKTITTPNFNTGGPYPTGKRCVWLVKSSSGKNVAMKIDEMDLSTDDGACAHWLEIQYNLIGQGGPKRCGKFSHETYVTSDSGNPSMMLLIFNSSFASNVQAGKGFTLSVSSVGAGCKSAPCVFGTCTDVGSSDFNCACASGYTGRLCDTLAGSGDTVCDFEGGMCSFSNLKSDSYDWVIKSGSTPSGGTGPSQARSGSNYLYTEMSYPVPTGTTFHYETPFLTAGQRCLVFWYHMYGSGMGTLNVLRDSTTVWTRSGDQGNQWLKAELNIQGSTNYKVIFEAIRGSDYMSDIAIDDISLTSAACGSPTTTTTTTTTTTPSTTTTQSTTTTTTTPSTTTTTTTPSTTTTTQSTTTTTTLSTTSTSQPGEISEINCDFEDGNCELSNPVSQTYDWTIISGGTPSSTTGPFSAHGGTRYLYVETSSPVPSGNKFYFESPFIVGGSKCLTFWYHMSGTTMGTLKVLQNGNPIWTRSGDQGTNWIRADVNIGTASSYKISFEATKGTSYSSDIALDDISTTTGTCIQSQINCDFEDDDCPLLNPPTQTYDWRIISGATPSSSTGPSGAKVGSNYLYAETSSPVPVGNKFLYEYLFDDGGSRCLRFWYHMYGMGMGTLSVLQNGNQVWTKSGNQGNQWMEAYIDIGTTTSYKISFEAVKGRDYRSDIALDDITTSSGTCGCAAAPCVYGTCNDVGNDDFSCSCDSGYTGRLCDTIIASSAISCDFENDDCTLQNSRAQTYDWEINSGGTPSSSTGPSSAKNGNNYLYVETSSPVPSGNRFKYESPFLAGENRCLRFWYHMYGSGTGKLNVLRNNTQVWTKSGNQGNQWIEAFLNVGTTANYKITFEAVKGVDYRSDIALDDVSISTSDCT